MSDIFDHEGDAINDLLFGERDNPSRVYRPYKPYKPSKPFPALRVCNRCRTGGLSWRQFVEGWRLVDSHGQQHRCPVLGTNVRG